MKPIYLTASEAADALGISLPTLYAYVSRGKIQAEVLDNARRTKRYRAEDVQRLKQRKEQRQNPAKVVEDALHFGTPILASAITLIRDNRLYYRGYDAEELARRCSLEQVAGLIWTGELAPEPLACFKTPPTLARHCLEAGSRLGKIHPVEAFQAILPLAAAEDQAAYRLSAGQIMGTGAKILYLCTAIAAGTENIQKGIAATLAQAWRPGDAKAATGIEQALILCADHELNVSSFTARCVASARATPYQVVQAGLAALQGARHGRETERVTAFLREAGHPERAATAVVERLRRDEGFPGFGHNLYPEGDPRGQFLVALARKTQPKAKKVALASALCEAAQELAGLRPTLDTGLVALSAALKLPKGSPLTLFALGRMVGWIGQAMETYAQDQLIRPRAKYTGVEPRSLPEGF